MPTLVVTGLSHTPKGRPKIQAGKDSYLLGDGLDVPPVGSRIEADTSSKPYTPPGTNKSLTIWWLNSWSLAKDQPAIAETKQIVQQAESHAHWQETEAVLRFVSNVIGNALAALRCQKPEEVGVWAKAALEAAQGVVKGKIVVPGVKIPGAPFDDEIPM
jgi:hypothetical protein